MRRSIWFFSIPALLMTMSACDLINARSDELKAVELRSKADVADCKSLGTTTAEAKDRWQNARNDYKTATTVLAKARAEAVSLGGNALVEKTALLNSRQTFSVYDCP